MACVRDGCLCESMCDSVHVLFICEIISVVNISMCVTVGRVLGVFEYVRVG